MAKLTSFNFPPLKLTQVVNARALCTICDESELMRSFTVEQFIENKDLPTSHTLYGYASKMQTELMTEVNEWTSKVVCNKCE